MNTNDQKTNRLQALAKRAGDLMVEAYLGGNRDRAVFFNKRMKRILWLIYADAQEGLLNEQNDAMVPRVHRDGGR